MVALADQLIREFAELPAGAVLRQLAAAGTALRRSPTTEALDEAVEVLARQRLQALAEIRGLPRPRRSDQP